MWCDLPSKVPESVILEGECSKLVSLCLKIRWSMGDPQNPPRCLIVCICFDRKPRWILGPHQFEIHKKHTVTDMEIGSVKSGNQWMINNPQVLKVWWFSEAGAEKQATGRVISPFDGRWFLAIERLTLMVDTKEEFAAQLKVVVFGHAIYTSSRVIKSRKKRLTCSFSGRCHLQYIFRYSYHQIAGLMFYYAVLFLHGREWDPWRLVGKLSTSIKEWRMAGRS